MDTAENLIYLRIALGHMCDGFSSSNSSKLTSLSIRTKILFLLKNGDLTPSELISALCIAKSNLVNTMKPMIEEGVVVSYRNENNSKNVFSPNPLTPLILSDESPHMIFFIKTFS